MQSTNPLNWFLGPSWSSCGRFLSRAVKLKRRRLTKFLTGPAPPPSTSARNFLEALKGKIIWFTRDLQITKGSNLVPLQAIRLVFPNSFQITQLLLFPFQARLHLLKKSSFSNWVEKATQEENLGVFSSENLWLAFGVFASRKMLIQRGSRRFLAIRQKASKQLTCHGCHPLDGELEPCRGSAPSTMPPARTTRTRVAMPSITLHGVWSVEKVNSNLESRQRVPAMDGSDADPAPGKDHQPLWPGLLCQVLDGFDLS